MLIFNILIDLLCTIASCAPPQPPLEIQDSYSPKNVSVSSPSSPPASRFPSVPRYMNRMLPPLPELPPPPFPQTQTMPERSRLGRSGALNSASAPSAPAPAFSLRPRPSPLPLFSRNGRQSSATDRQRNADFKKLENAISSLSQNYFKLDSKSGRPFVQIKNGWIEGYFQKTILGRPIAAFEGIPYGMPPTGGRRFKAPEPAEPWKGIKTAINLPPFCLQLDFSQGFRVHGSEDCLFLNVYTPAIDIDEPKGKPLPVVVFVHGGGFSCGWSGYQGASYFLNKPNKDVILVTINYRVGVLGFFTTGDEAASGNWGLKDQTLALKWVQQNIKYFGGDPSRVTLMGESAGGTAVGLHLVSPLSSGLFHRAISESGSALTHWSVVNDTLEHSQTVAQYVDCSSPDSFEVVRCLRTKNPYWIVGRMMRLFKYLLITRIPFGPVVESHRRSAFIAEDEDLPFLPVAPEVAYETGRVNKVPYIIGFNQDEGAFFAATIYLIPLMMARLNSNWDDMMTFGLTLDNNRTDNPSEVAQTIRKYYIKDEGLSYWNKRRWMQIFGDRTIVQGVHKGMQFHSQVAPTFGYVFNFQEDVSFLKTVGLDGKDWGVSHGQEMMFIFNSTTYQPLKVGTKDWTMSQFILNIWTNFAATGKPMYTNIEGEDETETPSKSSSEDSLVFWNPINDPEDFEVLSIDRIAEMVPLPFKKRLNFWENLNLRDDPKFRKFPTKNDTSKAS